MALTRCPYCRSALETDASLAGMTVACPYCRGQFLIEPDPLAIRTPPRVTYRRRREGRFMYGLASFLIPGAGQLLDERIGKGLAFLALWFLPMLAIQPFFPVSLLFVVPWTLFVWVWAVVDAANG